MINNSWIKKDIHQHKKKDKEKGIGWKQPLAWSTFWSWEDVLGFKETYSVIFET